MAELKLFNSDRRVIVFANRVSPKDIPGKISSEIFRQRKRGNYVN